MPTIQKSYIYKTYQNGVYLGNLPNVTSEFNYNQAINTAGAQITVKCAVSPDISGLSNDTIDDENGDPIQAEDGIDLLTEGQPDIIGVENNNNGIVLSNGNEVKVWEYSDYHPNGIQVFSGQIERIEADFGGDGGDDQTSVLIYSDGQDLDDYLANGSPYTPDVSQTAQDSHTTVGYPFDISVPAQSWTNGASNLGAIDLYMAATSPTTVQVKVYNNSTDAKNFVTPLGTASALVSNSTPGVVRLVFLSPIILTPGNTYFFTVIDPADTGNVQIYYKNSNAYAGGKRYSGFGVSPFDYFTDPVISVSDLYFVTYSSGGATTVVYTASDPTTDMVEQAVDDYVGRGGLINYSSGTIDATGLSLNYTFITATIFEVIQKAQELSPTGFYWYVDVGSNTLYMKQSSTTPDIVFTKGVHLNQLKLVMSIENIKNILYFSGGDIGGGVNLYSLYKDDASISQYRQKLDRQSDNRVTLQSTADAIGDSSISDNSSEQYQTTVTILNGTMDLTTLKLGMIVGFNGFKSIVDRIQMQIVEINYSPEYIQLTLGVIPKRIIPDFEKIRRGLIAQQTVANPDTPS